jgi:hypothetical protein
MTTAAEERAQVEQAAARVTAKPRDYLEEVERLAQEYVRAVEAGNWDTAVIAEQALRLRVKGGPRS